MRLRNIGLLILLLLAGRMAAQVPLIDSVCPGAERYYRVDGEAGSTYSWILKEPGGLVTNLPSDADTIHMFWSYDPGIYELHVIQHSLYGCDAEEVLGQVLVFEPADVYAGADQTIPYGTSTIIGDATATGLEPLSYYWEPASLLVDPTVLNPVTLNLDHSTTFTLLVKDGRGCESSDEVTIFITGEELTVNPTADPEAICLGGSAQLYANASGGSGNYDYNWTSDPPGFTSDQPNPTVNPSVTTNYIIVVNDGFNLDTGSVMVTVHPLPEVYAGADQLIPSGNSTMIGDATASGSEPLAYFWQPPGLLVDPSVLHPTTVNLFTSTTLTLTVTDGHGCANSDTVNIFIEGEPLAVYPVSLPDVICLNEPAQLFAHAIGGSGTYSYNWTSDPPGFTSVEENPVVSPAVTTVYTVEVNDGFSTVTGSVTVTVNALPEVFAGTDQTILYGNSTIIGDATATGAEPLTYSWTPAADLLDPTVLNPTTVSLYMTTVFTLTVFDANGCENSDEVTIFVEGEPLVVNPTAEPQAICAGEMAQLFANAGGGSGIYTYSWTSVPPGFISDKADPVVSPVVTTTYIVEVNDGSSTVNGSVMVTVYDPPVVFAGADQTIPSGTGTAIADATASGTGLMSYSWEPAGLLVDPFVLNPTTVILNDTTIFILTVNDGNGCMNTDSVTIFVMGEGLASEPSVEPGAICQRESAQLFANVTGGSGAYTYNWTSDPPGMTSGEADPVVNPLVTTTYIIEVDDGYSTVTSQVVLVVYPLPELTCPDDTAVCRNSAAFALASATPAGGSYTGEGVYLDNGVYYYDPSSGEGIYPITYTYTDTNGCTNTCLFNVSVLPDPEVTQTIITDETDGQQNGSVEIIANGTTPELYYSINNGTSWQTNNGLFDSLSFGVYHCVVMDENGCDTSFIIQINNIILSPLQAITGPDSLCLGNASTVPVRVNKFTSVATFRLMLSYNVDKLECIGYTNLHPALAAGFSPPYLNVAAGEITMNWESDVALTFTGIETVCELVFITKETGSGQLEWYTAVTESYFHDLAGNPIPVEFYTGQVEIYQPPEIFLEDLLTVCEGQEVTISGTAYGINPPLSYRWTYPGGYVTMADPYFDSVTMANGGIYTLLVTDAMGCTDQKSIQLVVSGNPVAAFHDLDTLIVQPGYILEAGEGMATYYWNTGASTESIPIFTEGWYWVEMTTGADCIGLDSVYILFPPVECLYIPNAFTPNGDGLNDTFKPVTICPIIYYRLLIYNRWGEQLFESHDISVGWDGRKNGNLCPGGGYVYMITYQAAEAPGGEAKKVEFGIVLLLK